MAVRIIKQDALRPGQIRPLSFGSGLPPVSSGLPSVPAWMEAAKQRKVTLPAEPVPPAPKESAAPSLDLAHLEKTAYENGFRQGEKAGMEMAERKMDAVMRRYSESILEVAKLKPALYAAVERDVARLALEVAKKIVHREIQADREIILTLVKVALDHVAEKSAVTVHLHPVDYNYLLEHRTELSHGTGIEREVILLADKSIERGGCLIQSECGDIDARIEEEFREVERTFFEGAKRA